MSDFPAARELVLDRVLKAPRQAVWRCWTEGELLKQWFAPKPLKTPVADLDVRPGGKSLIVMELPDGARLPNPGLYLEVVPGEKLVFTDAFADAWDPKEGEPFMVATLTFADESPGQTRYIARVRHWTTAATEHHEQMGFHTGWGVCADQLEALAASL